MKRAFVIALLSLPSAAALLIEWAAPPQLRPARAYAAPPSQAARVCDAARMPGRDVGARINACDRQLGPGPGTITHAGGGTISALITPGPDRLIKLGCGVYDNAAGAGAFRLASGNTVEGAGACTVVRQFPRVEVEPALFVFVPVNTYTLAGHVRSTPSRDIHIRNLTVDGAGGAGYGAAGAAINLGNCHDCSVTGVRHKDLRGIGVQAGGPSAGGEDPERLGMYAENVRIAGNTFDGVQSQQIAVVNGREVRVERNVVRRADSSKQSQTIIDIEPNTPGDRAENIYVTDNEIDNREGRFVGGVNGIGVQGVGGVTARNIVVRGNRVVGGDNASITRLTIGIFVSGNTENVVVENNEVRGASASAFRFYATGSHRNATLRGNTAHNSGTGGGSNYAVEIGSCAPCLVENNSVLWDTSAAGNAQMVESGASAVTYRGNRFRGNPFSGITKGAH